ncbi:ricin B lectin domain-containing protein [Gongronella butleri]|nr:ricin B lectin domain-containing protein [Gongronella butleri]
MHFPDGYFYIISKANGRAVDVDGASQKDGATVLLWPQKHNTDRDNQLWFSEDGFLVNKSSQKVLDIRGGNVEESAKIIQFRRKVITEALNQRWGYSDGVVYCLADPKFVLSVRSNDDGTPLILTRKKFQFDQQHEHQQWLLVPAGDMRLGREILFATDFQEK